MAEVDAQWTPSAKKKWKARQARIVAFIGAGAVIVGAALGAVGTIENAIITNTAKPGTIQYGPGPTETVTVTASASMPNPQPTPTRPGADAPAVQWGPNVVLAQNLDLDAVPPVDGSNAADVSSTEIKSVPALETYSAKIARWTGSSVPTYDDCFNLISTQGGGQLTVAKGDSGCMKTGQDRIVTYRVLSIIDDHQSLPSITLRATVYSVP